MKACSVGAVRVDDALRLAGGAGGVAHAGRGVLVELLPGEIAVGLASHSVSTTFFNVVCGMCAASVST